MIYYCLSFFFLHIRQFAIKPSFMVGVKLNPLILTISGIILKLASVVLILKYLQFIMTKLSLALHLFISIFCDFWGWMDIDNRYMEWYGRTDRRIGRNCDVYFVIISVYDHDFQECFWTSLLLLKPIIWAPYFFKVLYNIGVCPSL